VLNVILLDSRLAFSSQKNAKYPFNTASFQPNELKIKKKPQSYFTHKLWHGNKVHFLMAAVNNKVLTKRTGERGKKKKKTTKLKID